MVFIGLLQAFLVCAFQAASSQEVQGRSQGSQFILPKFTGQVRGLLRGDAKRILNCLHTERNIRSREEVLSSKEILLPCQPHVPCPLSLSSSLPGASWAGWQFWEPMLDGSISCLLDSLLWSPALPVTLPSVVGTNSLGLRCGWSELIFLLQSCQELNS